MDNVKKYGVCRNWCGVRKVTATQAQLAKLQVDESRFSLNSHDCKVSIAKQCNMFKNDVWVQETILRQSQTSRYPSLM